MEEEPEIQDSTSVMGVPTSVEDQLNTETSKPTKLNKNGKPRKQLSPEALERLAKAREKANAMRQQSYAKKLEEKVEK
jgi:ribosome-binding protein aMBF1 (putative translation factor)